MKSFYILPMIVLLIETLKLNGDNDECYSFEKEIINKKLKIHFIKNYHYLLSENEKVHQNGQLNKIFIIEEECFGFNILKINKNINEYYNQKNCKNNKDNFRIIKNNENVLKTILKEKFILKTYLGNNYLILLTDDILKIRKEIQEINKLNFFYNKKIECIQILDYPKSSTYDEIGNEFVSFEFVSVLNFKNSKLYNFEEFVEKIFEDEGFFLASLNNLLLKLFEMEKNGLNLVNSLVFIFKNDNLLLFDFQKKFDIYHPKTLFNPLSIFRIFINRILKEKMKREIKIPTQIYNQFFKFLYEKYKNEKEINNNYFLKFESALFKVLNNENFDEDLENNYINFVQFLMNFQEKHLPLFEDNDDTEFVIETKYAKNILENNEEEDNNESITEIEIIDKLFVTEYAGIFSVLFNLFYF